MDLLQYIPSVHYDYFKSLTNALNGAGTYKYNLTVCIILLKMFKRPIFIFVTLIILKLLYFFSKDLRFLKN